MGTSRFDERRLARMHDVLASHVERGELPGLVSLLARDGDVHVDCIGKLAVGAAKPMQRDSLFRISSMTKPITAVATLILIEDSKLRLDEPIDRVLPELANRRVLKRIDGPIDQTVPAARPITVRDLLTSRMGFGMLMGSPEQYPILRAIHEQFGPPGPPRPGTEPPPDEWLRRLGALPLMVQPGTQWQYNTAFDLLGVLIARASGKSFESFLRERIFEPLGMKDTSFSVPTEKLARLTTSYFAPTPGEPLKVFDAPEGSFSRQAAFTSGAGGLVSTVDDYAAFAEMLLQGGKRGSERILARPTVELMTTDHLTPEQKARSGLTEGDFDAVGFGFGVSVVTRRDHLASLGQYGWDGGLGSVWRNDPRERLTTILLTQQMWREPQPPALALDFWTGAYASLAD